MSQHTYYLILAAVLLALMPLVPHMLRLRIAVYRKVGWTGLADAHERNFGRLVTVVRLLMLAMAVVMVWLAFRT